MSSLDSPISKKDDSVGSIKSIVRETIRETLLEAVNSINPVIIYSGDIIDGKVSDLGNDSGTETPTPNLNHNFKQEDDSGG